MSAEEEFVEFAEASTARLRRAAFLLCGNWHTAEDLTQTALANVFVSWKRITRHEAVHAYALKTLVNIYLADKRRKRPKEILSSSLPHTLTSSPGAETRLVVLAALASLPPGGRAVLVLRFWADLSVDQVAAVLGCSTGNVKSQTARSLDKLRAALGDSLVETR